MILNPTGFCLLVRFWSCQKQNLYIFNLGIIAHFVGGGGLVGEEKLDQETWQCQTHLYGFVDKVWTLLDQIIPDYTPLDCFGQFWKILIFL